MLIVLVGPERFLVAQALESHLSRYSASNGGGGNFNLSRLDGARLAPEELERTVQSVGFFSEARVVVVEGLLSRFGGARTAEDEADEGIRPEDSTPSPPTGRSRAEAAPGEEFARILASVPEQTVLILVEKGKVNKNSTLFRAASRYGRVEEYLPLRGAALERWIADRCRQSGVRISAGAQRALASALPDLQTLANEIDKLALYVGEGGTIDEGVLRTASFISKQDDVFQMTSAVARRDAKAALGQLHRLIEGGTSPEGILPVLAWQVRTLMQVRDMLDRRVPVPRMPHVSGLNEFVVSKALPQAKEFPLSELRRLHSRLLELDYAVKTGQAEAGMLLEALVLEMCG